jgi:ketosteroid isomerase-like protein
MSPENADVIRAQFEATNEQDWKRAMSFYADDVVLVVDSFGHLNGTVEGSKAVGEWFGSWFSTFEPGYHFSLDDLRDLGGGRVFMVASHHGRGRGSGVEVGTESGYIYTVRDGKIVRLELFGKPADALAAAGLDE